MLLTGRALWTGSTERQVLNNIRNFTDLEHLKLSRRYTPLSSNAKDFVEALIRKDPNERNSAAELLRHPFLTQMHALAPAPIDGSVVNSFLRFAQASRFR